MDNNQEEEQKIGEQIQVQEEKEKQQQEEEELDLKYIYDLLDLMKDPKFEVRKQAQMVILQFSQSPENRKYFSHTQIIKQLLRSFTEEGLETISLSNLIGFTQDEVFIQQALELNSIERIVQLIKDSFLEIQENIRQGLTTVPKQLQLKMELGYLLLSNLTQRENGILRFLHLNEPEHEGVNFKVLMELFNSKAFEQLTNFYANTLANLSSYKDARVFLLNYCDKLLPQIFEQILHSHKDRRYGMLKLFRNLIFEYEDEKFLNNLLKQEFDIINKITDYIICLILNGSLIKNEGIKEQIRSKVIMDPGLLSRVNKFSPNQKDELVTLLDPLLTMINIENIEEKIKFNKEKLAVVLNLIRGEFEIEIRDKIDVVLCIFCKINNM